MTITAKRMLNQSLNKNDLYQMRSNTQESRVGDQVINGAAHYESNKSLIDKSAKTTRNSSYNNLLL
jgi:hypothetical protein